ncbi:MAG: hypothetical protein K5840_02555 [Eubacterium sp.]|nr:hypothetical protein [Eubacterium sp.]
MRQKLTQFMMGRYGTDDFSRFMLIAWVVVYIAEIAASRIAGSGSIIATVLWVLTIFLVIYNIFRTFSRNTSARLAENQKYLETVGRIKKFFSRMGQRRYYHFYKCPTCRQTIRVPRGHGRIEITCPKCRSHFIKKS